MNSYLFSIIIPVYNAEKTLLQTVESVVQQTYPNWELILVDDCSTDKSWMIEENCARHYSNVFAIKTSVNSGSAKHPCDLGMSMANGDYCLMVGNDDEISNNYLECLLQCIDKFNPDVMLSRCLVKDFKTKTVDNILPNEEIDLKRVYSGKEACLMTLPSWNVCANGMAFKRDLYKAVLEENPYNYMNSDEYSTRVLLIHAHRVAFSNGEYVYWQLQSSITHKNSVRLYESLYVDAMLVGFSKFYYDEEMAKIMYKKFLCHMIVFQKRFYKFRRLCSDEENNTIKSIISENYDAILKYRCYCNTLHLSVYALNYYVFRSVCRVMSLLK